MEVPDYSRLIDAETRAFIARTEACYPADTPTFPVARQREIYGAMCKEFLAGYPDGVSAETSSITVAHRAIPIRRYESDQPIPDAVLVYYHGGGFVFGDLESHDDICADLCGRTGFGVVSVDYRLAPEHTHPAAFDDALAAFRHVAEANADKAIILAGDSAGGALAAAVSHASRGAEHMPTAQVLIYPTLGGDPGRGSFVTHAHAPMLTAAELRSFLDLYSGGADIAKDPRISPLADTDFTGLPPTFIVTAECDPLADDGRDYRDRILAAGGWAMWINEKGLVHGYLRARHSARRARKGFERIVGAIRMMAKGRPRI